LKSSIANLSLLSTLCLLQLQAQATSAATAKAVQHPPRLVVAIIVDQFRFDYTTRFASRYTGGLHTMRPAVLCLSMRTRTLPYRHRHWARHFYDRLHTVPQRHYWQ